MDSLAKQDRGRQLGAIASTLAATLCAASLAHAQEYKTLRYDEDWSFLRDDSKRTDFLDALKYVPLDSSGQWYLSLAGEARVQYDRYSEPVFNQSPVDRNGFLLQRYLLSADLHATERFRLFAQLQSSLENYRAGGPRPTDRDNVDFHQLFADGVARFADDGSLTLRLGRQEFAYGSQRLISVRESPNNRLAFDAARTLVHLGGWRVDSWIARPVGIDPGSFDDRSHGNPTFWGTYATRPVDDLPGLSIDLYYLGLERAQAKFAQGTEREQRHSFGTRLFGTRGGLDWNFELVYQLGSFGGDEIRAWTIASETGFTFAYTPLAPRLFLRADVASGDHAGSKLGTFNPLFPKGAYFNEAAVIGPQNLIDLQPGLNLALSRALTLDASCDFVWRQSRSDGVYGTSQNLEVPPGASDARYVGAFPTATLRWQLDRHFTLSTTWVGYAFGAFVTESRPEQANGNYLQVAGTFKF